MAELTSKERIQKFFKKEPLDTMPVFSGMGTVVIQAVNEMNVKFAQVHTTAELLAGSALKSSEMCGLDAVVIPYDMATVAEAVGCGLTLYENSADILYPTVPNKWETLEEVNIPADFMKRARLPMVDEAFKILLKDGRFGVGAWQLGPFTLAGQIIELGLLLKGAKKNKEAVEAFLTKMTDIVIENIKRYESLGVDFLNIREMGSGTDLLSPKMWNSLIQPHLTRIFSALKTPAVLHICGGTDMIVPLMNQCGADALSFDQKNTLAKTREVVGNDVLVMGNFDPYGTLVQMENPEDVKTVVKKCIDDGVDAVWPGCDLWPDVKMDNVKAWVNTTREYGKKPSPVIGRL
jgi:[methyl-Co(III) methanol-specific corrinoid protein]:coenzyme M methyltransferase